MRKLGTIAIVWIGLVTLVQGVTLVGAFLPVGQLMIDGTELHPLLAYLFAALPFIGSLTLGALLIMNRHRLARRWFDDTPIDISLDGTALMRFSLIFIGVVLFTMAILSLFGKFPRIYSMATRSDLSWAISGATEPTLSDIFLTLLRDLVQLGLGALFVMRSQPLAERLWAGRTATPAEAGSDPAPLSTCKSCGQPFDPEDYIGGLVIPKCSGCGEPLDIDAG